MKTLKKVLALIIVLATLSTVCISAYANDSKTTETITFSNISPEELQNESLSQKEDDKVALFENGITDFIMVIPESCSDSLKKAVDDFQDILEQMTGTKLPVFNEKQANADMKLFCIGSVMDTRRPDSDIGDGYETVISDRVISVCGADEYGTINGVYAFAQDFLGCMYLTPDETYIPEHKSIYLEKTDKLSKPAVQWRDVYAYETVQNKWAAKLRLNGIDTESDENELNIEELQYEGWGTWCHNCYTYLSPDDYYNEHPEYFSEKNGKRVTEYKGREAYLCLSNPEVFEIVKESLAEKIKENPDKLYWDFSGNDNPFIAGCECKECKAADKAAGGTGMGTLLPFLNKLAKAFPDKYISTLAYLHTLKAPENIKAEPNVVIKLCSMPGDQASSYFNAANANSKQFKEQVEQWSKITDKIVVWDYVVNFSHLLMPFPNFAVQAKNQKFYEDNNVIGVFHQASREKGGEFACLRAYVLSQLMWEGSNMNVEECVSRYIAAYYGKAAADVIEFMNLCAHELYKSNNALGLYDGLIEQYNGYLSKENVEKYNRIISNARSAADGDEVLEARIDEIEISVLYANVLQPKLSKQDRQYVLNRINELCNKHNITMVCEWESLEDFNKSGLKKAISNEKKQLNKAYYITAGILGALALIAIITVQVILMTKKQKKKKSGLSQ